jgi:carboxypeptidase family protein
MRVSRGSQTAAAALATLTFMAWPSAQDRAPQRDIRREPAVGTGVIAGTLVTDDAAAGPIRRAMIYVSGGAILRTRSTVTDDAGRFTFTALPAANFSIYASKPGYVTTYYGGRRPGRGPGVPIALAEGQHLTIALKMLRGAVLAGRISDPEGRPIQAQVQVLQYQTIGGEKVLRPAYGITSFGSTTDDRGMYRVWGLAPGDYLVSATVRATPGELRAVTPAEIQWARQQVQPAGAGVGGVSAAAGAPPERSQTVGYSPVYFPGTFDPAAASVVSLGAGEERTGIDFALQMVRTAKVEGSLLDPEGRIPAGAQVNLFTKSYGSEFSLLLGMPRATVSNGRFVFAGVTPGAYFLTARGRAAGPGGAGVPGRGASAPVLWSTSDVTVSGEDVADLTIRLEPGISITGRVAFESATGQKPANLAGFRVSLSTWQGTGPTVSITVPPAQVDDEGQFRFASVVPGRYAPFAYAGAMGPDQTPQWVVKSIVANGQDVTDVPLEIRPREAPPEIVITVTDRVTEVTGTLFDAAGRPSSGLSIILFPTRRDLWTMSSRRIRPITPSSDGKFRLAALPPGEYYIAAVTDYEYTDLTDGTFLEQLAAGAFKITLAEGEKKVQDIRMGKT